MIRIILPLLIILTLLSGAWYVKSNQPHTKQRADLSKPSVKVVATTIEPKLFQVSLESYGIVKPKTQILLTVQVGGMVTAVNPKFEAGAFFKQGEILLTLDKRDYQSAINSTKATLTQAQQELRIEQAQVKQALADWKRLGNKGTAPALVSRKPQELIAKAKVSSAYASYNKAITDLERSKISAPFDGRVIARSVNIGQYVNANTQVGEIFATDSIEVRLPLQNSDLALVNLPKDTLDTATQISPLPKVTLISDLADNQSFNGRLVKTEAVIDESTQQLYVVARIEDPYANTAQEDIPLKIGQYVSAVIEGKTLHNQITIPIDALYQGEYVYLIIEGAIQKRNVTIRWKNSEIALISDGLNKGDLLVTTTLAQISSGTLAQITVLDGIKKVLTKKRTVQSKTE